MKQSKLSIRLTYQRSIPYHKKGKKLMFLKSEIDNWLKEGRRKTGST
ncbi:MAG: helix-turn-helix domain-containing protein [Prevotellaceae bacterium]|nr:helix-turn-helix domain-containing protein [Prevotellaceae bacterium]